MRINRKRADFIRVRAGITQRQCKRCNRWLPETSEHYGTHGERGHQNHPYTSRCRPCAKAVRQERHAERQAATVAERVEVTVGAHPPELRFDVIARWLL